MEYRTMKVCVDSEMANKEIMRLQRALWEAYDALALYPAFAKVSSINEGISGGVFVDKEAYERLKKCAEIVVKAVDHA